MAELLQVTKESLYVGIAQFKANNRVGDVGHAIQNYTEAAGYGVVRELVGHGLGTEMHEHLKCLTTVVEAVENSLRKAWW